MENLIWIMLLVIALLIVDVIMLRQRVSKLQKQLNEALKNQVNLKQQVIKLDDNVLKGAKHIKVLTDNVERIVDIVHVHIIGSDSK
jgi:cell division protein FtsB